jgi:hypothetical protein
MKYILENVKRGKALIESEIHSMKRAKEQQGINSSGSTLDLQAIANKVWNFERDRASHRRDHEQAEELRRQRQEEDVFKWIAASETTELDHQLWCDRRSKNPGSGRWILGQDKVENWISVEDTPPSHSTLWFHGKKGAGTYLVFNLPLAFC